MQNTFSKLKYALRWETINSLNAQRLRNGDTERKRYRWTEAANSSIFTFNKSWHRWEGLEAESRALVKATYCLCVGIGICNRNATLGCSISIYLCGADTHPRFDVFGRRVMALVTFPFCSCLHFWDLVMVAVLLPIISFIHWRLVIYFAQYRAVHNSIFL